MNDLLADRQSGYIHINDVYRLVAGHSNYHGDDILSAFTCLTEGKEVKPIRPLARPTGKWIMSELQNVEENTNGNYQYRCSNCGRGDVHTKSITVPYCWHCGARMEGDK